MLRMVMSANIWLKRYLFSSATPRTEHSQEKGQIWKKKYLDGIDAADENINNL